MAIINTAGMSASAAQDAGVQGAIQDTNLAAANNPISPTPNYAAGQGYAAGGAPIVTSPSTSIQYGGSPTNPTTNTEPLAQYAVVTSQPAQQNVSDLQNFYNNTTAGVNTQANNNNQNNQAPIINGYNVTTTPSQGAITVQSPSNGQTYYATPSNPGYGNQQPPTANDIINALNSSSASTSTTATSGSVISGSVSGGVSSGSATNPNPSGIDINSVNSQYNSALGTAQSDIENAYNSYNQQVQQLQNGTFPLTSAQSTLLNATTQAFNAMINNSQLKAAALSSETGGLSSKINATLGEQANIQATMASSLAKMEQGFQQQDYTLVNDAYTAYTDMESKMTDLLTAQHTAVVDQYNTAISQNMAQQTFNETQYKDAQDLADSRYDFEPVQNAFGQRIGTQAYDKQTGQPVGNTILDPGQSDPTDPTAQTTPVVTTDPSTGAPDPSAQASFLASIPKAYQSLVQGIASGNIEPPSARTAQGAQILAWVAQYDPTLSDGSGGFNATAYAARLSMSKALASTASGSLGSNIDSGNKFVSHLAAFASSVEGLGNQTVSPTLNAVLSSISTPLSGLVGGNRQEVLSQANTVSVGLSDELSKFFGGTGGTTESSIASWAKGLDVNATPNGLNGTVNGALTLFGGQLMTYVNQYSSTMGVSPSAAFSKLIQPQAMQTLSAFKNAGYNLGEMSQYVPYTDASAYIAADPANQQTLASIVKEYPNLSQAQALQLAQTQ